MSQRFVVGFQGELASEEQDALQRAGYAVFANAAQAGPVYWPDEGEPPADWDARHAVQLEADDRDDALRKVVEVMGRDLDSPVVGP
jgi:hypothetical protein